MDQREDLPLAGPGLPYWQEKLCLWLVHNATSVNAAYRLPEDRLLEIGLQVWL
jgi:K+ transporter